MSVLVPSQDQLMQRSVKVEKRFELLDWFLASEFQAWKMVDIYYPSISPNTLFLVVGQVLTNEFHISHKTHGSVPCEIRISSDIEISDEPNITTLQSLGIQRVNPCFGFEKCRRRIQGNSGEFYSIVLDWYPSTRVQRFRQEFLSIPLESIFKSNLLQISSNLIDCSKSLPFPCRIRNRLQAALNHQNQQIRA